MCAAQTAAASSFPATESLDTFERAAENPLSDGGKWSKLGWAKSIGRVFSATYGWTPSEGAAGAAESEASGAFWNGREFAGPAVSVHMYAESLKDYVGVWCDATGTSSSRNGYRLKVLGTGASDTFKLLLEKWVNGTRTQLAESNEIAFKASSENVIGITAIGGRVQAWYGTSEAGLAVESEASDTTFSHGYVGIEGTNDDAYGETKYRASGAPVFPTTESLDTFERAAENPLSDGGKWSKLGWAKTIGRVYSATFGWVPKEGAAGASETEADGAYWNGREFTNPAVSVHMYAENLKDYVGLWSDATGSSSSRNGYRLKALGTGSSYRFRLLLERWVNGTRTLLAESPEVAFKGSSSENVIGITTTGGRIDGWYGTTEAGLAVEAEASDTTFSHGYVGIEGTNNDAYGETKYRAAQYETAAEREAKEKEAKEKKEREEREAKERKEREEREAKEKREREERELREADEREYCKTVTKHCYAFMYSTQTYEGTWVDMLDSDAAVYENWGRMQNETWASFGSGEWVEDGATLGYVGGPNDPKKHVSSPVWFYAGQYPAGVQNYYEFDYEYGPALGNWYYMQEQDEGNGTWCAWLQGGEANCVAGRPEFTSSEEAGLEASTENPYNYGTAYAWGMNLGSGSWSGWANPHNYYTETPTGEKYCTIPVEWNPNTGLADPGGSGDYAAGVAFGIPNSNPSCESNGGDAIMAGPAPTPFGGSLTSTPAEGPVPASYTPPSGPSLSSTALGTIASEVAGEDGDAAIAPSTMMAVQTPLEKAISATEPSTVLPTTRTESQSKLLKSTTELVVLHGQFSAPNAPRPSGEPAPSGSVLELIIDAHTGWVDGYRLGGRQHADLNSLGQAAALG